MNSCFKRKDSTAWRKIEGTIFLVSPATKKIYPLNEVGGFIWLNLGEEISFDALIKRVHLEFEGSSLDTISQDIQEFLESLVADGLAEKVS